MFGIFVCLELGLLEDEGRGPAIVNSINSTAWILVVLLMTQPNVVITFWVKSMLKLCTLRVASSPVVYTLMMSHQV